VPIVWKSGTMNLMDMKGHVHVCNGIAVSVDMVLICTGAINWGKFFLYSTLYLRCMKIIINNLITYISRI
jgi:hypothetical protein